MRAVFVKSKLKACNIKINIICDKNETDTQKKYKIVFLLKYLLRSKYDFR